MIPQINWLHETNELHQFHASQKKCSSDCILTVNCSVQKSGHNWKTPIQHWWNMNVAYVVITVYYAKRLENHEIYQQKATDTILNLWIAYLSCSADLTSTQSNDSIQTKTFSTFLFTKDHFSLDKKECSLIEKWC